MGTADRFATESDTAASEEEIAKRAYELYLGRGGADGGDLDDWLQAERDLGVAKTASD